MKHCSASLDLVNGDSYPVNYTIHRRISPSSQLRSHKPVLARLSWTLSLPSISAMLLVNSFYSGYRTPSHSMGRGTGEGVARKFEVASPRSCTLACVCGHDYGASITKEAQYSEQGYSAVVVVAMHTSYMLCLHQERQLCQMYRNRGNQPLLWLSPSRYSSMIQGLKVYSSL
ncbi:hypothetical protein BJ508DRAFT_152615 [Ascobolus immersus RN42]|uniref:Uncharacterized protein n=1 Tax=Ascobolus immersus RN42 TaxID=1160509 RepID=A0A3N4I058_ASCIM|nr:hypothetical protein BJ508DRAFT_152615 [Ascobolus immersus RN42]